LHQRGIIPTPEPRELISSTCPERNNSLAEEAIFGGLRSRPETIRRSACAPLIKQRSTVMSAFLTAIYHEFCKARLAEMRQVAGH
jgi:hypothetical protein